MAVNMEPLFRFVLNNSQELIFRYDSYGSIVYANERAMELTGYTADEIRGAFIGEVFSDIFGMTERYVTLKEEYRDKNQIDTVAYRKNKTCFPVALTMSSIVYEGEVVFFAMAIDMTVYKESIRRIEEKTREADESMKARDTFVANVTHELRTPVNGIKGNTEMLIEKESDMQKLATLKMITDACTTMEAIINNILDFSKLEAGKFQIDEKPFSFYEFMDKMEKQFTALTMRKGLRFMLNIAEDVPDALIGDELRLTQILNNLVSNAVKFTAQGYVGIEVTKNSVAHDEVELFFVVADTGIGLSTEDKDKLFKSFSQVDASITRKYGGTGLGLSITKELVTMMHGDIRADGERGKGSTFSFTIRLRMQEAAKEEETKAANIGIMRTKSRMSQNLEAEHDLMYEFGSEINERELRANFEKMNLSADMDCWYKAENYAGTVKQLVSGGSKDLQRAAFRMEMAVRKSDYDKFRETADEVKRLLAIDWKAVTTHG